jgi:hypothetical protein
MSDGNRASVLRGDFPAILTYVYPDPGLLWTSYQLQWDYQIEWLVAGRPKIKLLRYRSFQKKSDPKEAELVEDISEDIPVNDLLLSNISKHAAGYICAQAELDGNWRLTNERLFEGSAEAAKKRFSLSSFRQMMQVDPVDPNSRLF